MIFRIIITAVVFFFVYRFLERLFGSGQRRGNVPTPQPPPRAANPELRLRFTASSPIECGLHSARVPGTVLAGNR